MLEPINVKKLIFWFAALLISSSVQAQKLLIPVPLGPPATVTNNSGLTAETTPEPERWTKEDLTLDEQYSTATKEAQAAFHEAKIECRTLSSPEQATCLILAKNEFDREMASIKKRFGLPD